MIKIRKSDERGHVNYGWLDTYYTFSFANYYDPEYMGFSNLRVINEDKLKGGHGFDAHPHRDMEIVTYVIEGALEHKDSMGNSSIIKAGDFQKMTAGNGVIHSEYNASQTETVHLFQIWILPDKTGLTPQYEQVTIDRENNKDKLLLVATGKRDKDNGIIFINQDTDIYLGFLKRNEEISHKIGNDRNLWLHVIKGNINLSGHQLSIGDGAAINNEDVIEITSEDNSEIMIFNMN